MLRNMCLCVVALASMLVLAGCQTAPEAEQKRDTAADIQAINAGRDEFAAAFNSNNAAAVAAGYTDDAVLMFPDQPAIEGKQAIQAALEDYFKQNAAKITHTPLETQVAGDWAYERGNITETVTPKSGKTVEKSLKYLVILKRQADGSWKVHLDMDNSNLKETP
jgi:uncharacterized protein (TIGR02246 family)